MDEEEPRLSFIGRRLDPRFAIRFTRIPPGAEHPFRGVDWAEALVVVEHGILELEAPGGAQTRFVTGDILSLAGVPPHSIRNSGSETVLLAAARRRGWRVGDRSNGCFVTRG
jgi:quercetin dioxygenase-like cupin family protein